MAQTQEHVRIDPHLTLADKIVLQHLVDDLKNHAGTPLKEVEGGDWGSNSLDKASETTGINKRTEFDFAPSDGIAENIEHEHALSNLRAMNDPTDDRFEPTVFFSVDLKDLKRRLPHFIQNFMLQPYIQHAQRIARNPIDVVMVTHLILYFTTTVPSVVYLYYSFHWWHGVAHILMTGWYMGTYTLMTHNRIHMKGVLNKKYWLIDTLFPYIIDPLMGYTWNSYYYHHKQHHVEDNGPDDLSSTVRYQRDDIFHFIQYVSRFFFLIWFDLPRYFIRKRQFPYAAKMCFFEIANYAFIYYLGFFVNCRATIFAFILPLVLLRAGLMVGNWGQHAFVDEVDPESSYRSSITLIDVPSLSSYLTPSPSNRYCFNDGYHTTHHANPRRHWRDHPVSFLTHKQRYVDEGALVLHGLDYIMITVKLLQKDYRYLAERMIPIGSQIDLSIDERAQLLRRKTKAFTEEEIRQKWKKRSPGGPWISWKMQDRFSSEKPGRMSALQYKILGQVLLLASLVVYILAMAWGFIRLDGEEMKFPPTGFELLTVQEPWKP